MGVDTKAGNLQNLFLARLNRESLPVVVRLLNGPDLEGTISGFDNYVVLLKQGGTEQMLFKHAISAIIPRS